MNILLPGQYPRSEKLVAATRDYDRKRISQKEFDHIRKEDMENFKQLQNGLPYYSTGLFNWQDLMRPFADLVEHAKAESLSRFFETNTFWRLLELEGKFKIKEEKLDDWVKTYFFGEGSFSYDTPMVFTLPFLYLFKEYSQGMTYDDIAILLGKVCEKLSSFPNKLIVFSEPTFGWKKLSQEEMQKGRDFLQRLKKNSSTPLFLNTYFFSIEHEIDSILSLPVDGVGIDFYANSLAKTVKKFPENKTLLAGIINTQSTLFESENNIHNFLQEVSQYLPEQRVFLTYNGPAELLPRAIMDQKVNNLQEIIQCLPKKS